MTGGGLVGLFLISMAALFFVGGLILNWTVFRQHITRKEGERAWSSMGPLPGIAGSVMLFFLLPALMKHGIEVPWPWLWILLPLVVDPFCLGGVVLMVLGAVFGRR